MARTRSSAGTSGGRGRGRGENEDSGQGRGSGRGTGRSGGRGIGRGTGPEVVQGVGRGAGRGNEQAGGRGTGRGVGRGAGRGGGRGSGRGRGRGEAENETTNEQTRMQPDPAMIAMITQVVNTILAQNAQNADNEDAQYDDAQYEDAEDDQDEEAILRSEAMTKELVQCGTITAIGTKRKETSGMNNNKKVWRSDGKRQNRGKVFVVTDAGKKEYNRGNQAPAARGRAFVLNAAEARNEPNVVVVDVTILCSAKIVRIPLPNGEILEVQGEVSNSFEGRVMSASAKEVSLINVPVVRDYQDVFPDDLPGLPPSRQLDFRISLVPNAAPVAKSPYR
uniref:merozoite surface antigen 2-like n=1 Tax=Erigeron canadensis TaxID=72917 RepID=UPI001CB94FE1|nr:merozoite surface antigen 2-like [Erigeron canadensis]